MFIDTHCHPYLSSKKKTDAILNSFKNNGGKSLISIGVDYDSSQECITLSQNSDFIKASVGVHPCYVTFDGESISNFCNILENTSDLIEIVGAIKTLAESFSGNVVAIGECGLDYYRAERLAEKYKCHAEDIKTLQKYYFKAQILLAQELYLPFIIHNREAGDDIFEVLKEYQYGNFVLHCFAEDLEYAEKCIRLFPECMISFSGIVTFNNALKIQEVAQKIPLKHLLIETDSPYLTPVPLRGKEENEPQYCQFVLKKIQELRNESPEIIEKTILQNSKRFFKI